MKQILYETVCEPVQNYQGKVYDKEYSENKEQHK